MLQVILVDYFDWFPDRGLGEDEDAVCLWPFVGSSQQAGKRLLLKGAVPWVCYCKCLPGIEEPVVQALASCVSPAHGPLTEDAELVHQEQRPQWVCASATSQVTVSLEPDLWLRGFRWNGLEAVLYLLTEDWDLNFECLSPEPFLWLCFLTTLRYFKTEKKKNKFYPFKSIRPWLSSVKRHVLSV